ncbi:MAG: IS110 family transposase [Thermoguttaceae bacterium]|jgi:transposase
MAGILALDLGKCKSVSCFLRDGDKEGVFATHVTDPAVFHDLFVEVAPDAVVIEVGSVSGWVVDLCRAMGIKVSVANTNDDRWVWRNVKRKTDRDDARKLAVMCLEGKLPEVHVPVREVRQWRSLIEYRAALVRRRTAVRNTIHAIMLREGKSLKAVGGAAWTSKRGRALSELARPLAECSMDQLWRGMLDLELRALERIAALIDEAEEKLDALATQRRGVELLRTIPGVGPRLSEIMVAVIDDPHRFKNARQVGAYAGLVPRQYESGQSIRMGRITGRGNPLLRALLTEVSWLMKVHNAHFRDVFARVERGTKARRKIAAVATSRRLLVSCWAMLRDNTPWRAPLKQSVPAQA